MKSAIRYPGNFPRDSSLISLSLGFNIHVTITKKKKLKLQIQQLTVHNIAAININNCLRM